MQPKYDDNNIFAKIIRREVPCNFIYEDEYSLAFNDISPAAPTHVLILPKSAYISYSDFMNRGEDSEISAFFKAVRNVAKILDVEEGGYRLISNCGRDANQTVAHFHMHLLAGRNMGSLLSGDLLQR
jgi:diadenosine tetraphosphate (Ap4A) HIT family hydrolase